MTEKPDNHPMIKPRKIGILFANLGTPDGYDYWSMRRYLGEFLSDQRVVDLPKWLWQPILQGVILTRRPFSSGKAYESIWNHEANESPLLTITKQQVAKLHDVLNEDFGGAVHVDFGMRYGNPTIKSRVETMVSDGCDRILFFPLYPQYAAATTATANEKFFEALPDLRWAPAVRTVEPYFDRTDYIDALAESVTEAYAKIDPKPEVLVASYHGLPKKVLLAGDPYHCQCLKTTRLLRERLGWSDTQLISTFQSRFGPAEWLQPYTVEEVARLAKDGVKNIAVMAPAFSADCIETLEEIQEEIKDAFIEAGGENFTYIPCLNDRDAHIDVLAQIVRENLTGWI